MPPDTKHRLETRRAALVRELAAINRKLRQREPGADNDDWDYDPRVAQCAVCEAEAVQ